jgi:hypothetical protein
METGGADGSVDRPTPAGKQGQPPSPPGRTTGPGHPAGLGVLLAVCVSALIVNANTSAVTILLPAIMRT